ncbi:uncharacterized protein LOC143591300 isoform X2 [Bidens hawaiensis]
MDESGGGAGTRGVGAGTCDGKSALAKHGGSGTRDIHIQEPNSRRSARGKDDGDNRWILRMRRKYVSNFKILIFLFLLIMIMFYFNIIGMDSDVFIGVLVKYNIRNSMEIGSPLKRSHIVFYGICLIPFGHSGDGTHEMTNTFFERFVNVLMNIASAWRNEREDRCAINLSLLIPMPTKRL